MAKKQEKADEIKSIDGLMSTFKTRVPKEFIQLFDEVLSVERAGNLFSPLSKINFPEFLEQYEMGSGASLITSRYRGYNQNQAVEIIRYLTFIKSKQLDIEFKNANKLHWLLGMISDLRELEFSNSDVNFVEELGDVLFFMLSYAMEYNAHWTIISGLMRPNPRTVELQLTFDQAYRELANLSDIEKGLLTSGKPGNYYDVFSGLVSISSLIIECLHAMTKSENIPVVTLHEALSLVIVTNMEKLGYRYKNSYNADEDIQRNTVTEESVMSKEISK
ncbi:gp27 [Sphingomonas phage PAU]|uniref:gp27 n=1 Tax=Sphingomonas phage PAU TaxID=1150991 RepID=UPI0002573120|nr:gp27 [Sphingomonas phage PAU]AFF28025.1 gp27 [Sphingomonas phage PAU]